MTAWYPGKTFDRALERDEKTMIIIPMAVICRILCDRGVCVPDSSICGEIGECPKTAQYKRRAVVA